MKVENFLSPNSSREVPNQFLITGENGQLFQSYTSAIVLKGIDGKVHLSSRWDYGVTTGKYRNQFLGETKKETQAKIDSGEYLCDLDWKTGEVGEDWRD